MAAAASTIPPQLAASTVYAVPTPSAAIRMPPTAGPTTAVSW